jgi:hypothetical protein
VRRHGVLGDPQRKPFGDGDLLGDKVHPGDRLGHRVLRLEAGVHPEEGERAGRARRLGRPWLCGTGEERHRRGAAVAQPADVRDSGQVQARP